MQGTKYFDQAAATWDLVDRRVLLAQAVVEAIATRVPLSRQWSVLDFGCGTGLVALGLGPRVGSITGADTSPGMLQTLAGKAADQGLALHLIQLGESGPPDLGGPYDLIVSSMTLHHVPDVPALLRRFAKALCPGAPVALADLDEEDGRFHESLDGVHHRGFRRSVIQSWLEEAGFEGIQVATAAVVHKEERDYPVFLATARVG